MLASIRSILGWKEQPSVISPPSVTITGVRIPADGSPAHLLSLTTINNTKGTDSFLYHVPDLRSYWKTEQAWECKDIRRLDLQQDHHVPQHHYLQQKHDLQRLLQSYSYHTPQKLLHLRQRYLHRQHTYILQQQHYSCVGAYWLFYSFAADDLPKNSYLPTWILDYGDYNNAFPYEYSGDVFIVKMARLETEEHGWAVYEDIVPEFLHLLSQGPLDTEGSG